jgi:RNase P subunit RPR2
VKYAYQELPQPENTYPRPSPRNLTLERKRRSISNKTRQTIRKIREHVGLNANTLYKLLFSNRKSQFVQNNKLIKMKLSLVFAPKVKGRICNQLKEILMHLGITYNT